MIKQEREKDTNLLVLDAGDAFIRDRPPATTSQGKSSVEMLNLMGYDAMALGEGDLGILGPDIIQQRILEATFAILSANVLLADTGELLAEPYAIREIEGHRVAIIGLTGQADVPGIEIRDPVQAAREAVDQLRGQADVLILLSHVGMGINRQIAADIPEIDLIVSGGESEYTSTPEYTPGGPAIVQADASLPAHAGRRLGIGSWVLGTDDLAAQSTWQSIALTPDVPSDPDMEEWVKKNG